MEIIQRLQKNLDILIQSMTRVSSRSEMLGAIHQVSGEFKHVFCMTREQTLIVIIQWFPLFGICRRVVLERLWR